MMAAFGSSGEISSREASMTVGTASTPRRVSSCRWRVVGSVEVYRYRPETVEAWASGSVLVPGGPSRPNFPEVAVRNDAA
jgi:hypothetical protein